MQILLHHWTGNSLHGYSDAAAQVAEIRGQHGPKNKALSRLFS